MLKNYNDDYFNKKDLYKKGIIFFIQRWLEIFEPKTLDTYQYPMVNVIVGMQEYIDVIDKTLDGSFSTGANVQACQAELLRIFKEEDITFKYAKGLRGRLINHLSKTLKRDDKAGLLRAKSEIKYSLKIIEPQYQDWLMDELYEDIMSDDLEKIQFHTKCLSSFSIYNGWTARGASKLVSRIFGNCSDSNFDYIWNYFKEELNKQHDYTVYINLKFNTKVIATNDTEVEELLKRLGIDILTYDQVIENHKDIDSSKLPINKDKKYMIFKGEARDVNSAALKAVYTLNNKMTILSFYGKLKAWSFNDVDGVVILNDTKYLWSFKIEDLFKTYLFLDSSNKVFESTMDVYSKGGQDVITTQSALKGVFSYTNISLLSVFPEEKFMNLWIALESFMRTGQYDNIISHVKEVLPAVLCTRYIYRLVRNFAEDCIRCKIKELELSTGTIYLEKDLKKEMVEELVRAIRNETTFQEIKNLCNINVLLSFRVEEIQTVLKDNISVIEKLRKYYETVSWHIQRLYRIRNEIAHSAIEEDNYLISYIEHLHDYLAILITEIVFVCTEKNIQPIGEIFPYLKDNYEAFNSIYENNKLLVKDFQLNDGVINYLH